MLETHLRRLVVGVAVCAVGGAIVGGVGCTTSPRKNPVVTTGAAGSSPGAAGSTTGAAGDASGAAGSATGAAGAGAAGSTTGAAGDASGAAGAGAAGAGVAGAGAAGDASGAAGAGAAGAPDNTVHIPATFPVAVTQYWYPSGWDGDAATVAQFASANAPIKIEDQSTATTGPCSKRVAGHVGSCFKITYTPVASDGGATHASVALLANVPGTASTPNFDNTMAPHVPAGAMSISAEVAGDVGGESVQFNLWDSNSGDLFTPTFAAGAAAQTWQKIKVAVPAGADQETSPFGWYTTSTTPIVFYYDDVRIDSTP